MRRDSGRIPPNLSVSRIETGTYATEVDAAPKDEFVTDDRFGDVVAKTSPSDIAELVLRVLSSGVGPAAETDDRTAAVSGYARM